MTPEEFIRDCTRGCSNELGAVEDRFGKRVISYHEWLTPDQALRAVEIAREEMKKPASAGASASEELEIEIERWYDNEASEGFENVLWEDISKCAHHFANWQKQQIMKDAFCQEIYYDGYAQGKKEAEARSKIGKVYAKNHQMRDLESICKMVQENPKRSDEYKKAYAEFTERYLGVIEFSRDVDKVMLEEMAQEQARIVRDRIEQRYKDALNQGRITEKNYVEVVFCIDAVYQELFFTGFKVGLGEFLIPKITLNEKEK